MKILKGRGFSPHKRFHKKTIGIYISGKNSLDKWIKEVGFNSLKNNTKYQLWDLINHYIPRVFIQERIDLLIHYDHPLLIRGSKYMQRCPSGLRGAISEA